MQRLQFHAGILTFIALVTFLVLFVTLEKPVDGMQLEVHRFNSYITNVTNVDIDEDGTLESTQYTVSGNKFQMILTALAGDDHSYWAGFDIDGDQKFEFTLYDADGDADLDFSTIAFQQEIKTLKGRVTGEELLAYITGVIHKGLTIDKING